MEMSGVANGTSACGVIVSERSNGADEDVTILNQSTDCFVL